MTDLLTDGADGRLLPEWLEQNLPCQRQKRNFVTHFTGAVVVQRSLVARSVACNRDEKLQVAS